MTTKFVKSERLQKLPPYLFAEIDKKKKAAIAAGRDVINLGVGDPDRPTPTPIIRSLQHHVENPAFHQYALDQGRPELRRSIAAFCKTRYGIDLDPDTEILPLIGSKEGIAHFPLAVLNPGEISLVPDPCYPVYRSSSMFAGADVYTMPLEPLARLPTRPRRDPRRRLLAGPADVPELSQQPDRRHGRPGLSSAGRQAGPVHTTSWWRRMPPTTRCTSTSPCPSILQVAGAKDVAIEFHSLSKTFNMTGWRVGFAIGGAPLIAALGQVKANTDSGIFTAIQFAAKTALDDYDELTPPIRALYKERRDAFVGALRKLGWDVPTPEATFYVWIPCPKGYTSTELCSRLLDEAERRDHPRPRLRPDRRRLHPRRLDRGNPATARGRRADRQAQLVKALGPRP